MKLLLICYEIKIRSFKHQASPQAQEARTSKGLTVNSYWASKEVQSPIKTHSLYKEAL